MIRVEDRGHDTPCHIWQGQLNERGYGLATVAASRLAHRAVWIEKNGPVPDGLELDHLCRVRACVNPGHLEPVTHAENMRRGYQVSARPAPDGLPAAIRQARHEWRVSQATLARMIGASQGAIALWERGKVRPGRLRRTALLAFLLTEPRPDAVSEAMLEHASGAAAQERGPDGQTFGGRRAA